MIWRTFKNLKRLLTYILNRYIWLNTLLKLSTTVLISLTVLAVFFCAIPVIALKLGTTFCATPAIALKLGITVDGMLGYIGAVVGSSIGALVAGWGITATIKANQKQAIAPYLIFQEVSEIPENTKPFASFVNREGDTFIRLILSVKNVGSGAAIDCTTGEYNTVPSVVADIIDKDEEKYVLINCPVMVLDNEKAENWTQDEKDNYLSQSETVPFIFNYKDILGTKHSYRLLIEIKCSIGYDDGNTNNIKCFQKLTLNSWEAVS